MSDKEDYSSEEEVSDSEQEQGENNNTEELKNLVKEWTAIKKKMDEIDPKMKELRSQMKILTTSYNEIDIQIRNIMKNKKLDNIETTTGNVLKVKKKVSVSPLKQNDIYSALFKELNDEVKAQYLTSKIWDPTIRKKEVKEQLQSYKK
jgi:hypothetical protein